MPASISRRGTALVLALVVVLIDQLSKSWVSALLAVGESRPLLGGLLNLQLVYNDGAAFSLLSGGVQLLAWVSLVVAVALLVWILRSGARMRPWQAVGLGLLLGGTVGNGLDRWRLGAVVDFLDLVPISFPIFNGADVAINLAVLALVIDLLRPNDSNQR